MDGGSFRGEGGGEAPGGGEDEPEVDLPEVVVVYKTGIRVDGTNEKDRDDALSEVSRRWLCYLR